MSTSSKACEAGAGSLAFPASAGAHPNARDASLVAEAIHPALWCGQQLGHAGQAAVVPSGWRLLDEQLPGGGWPRRTLTELLLRHPGVGEMRFLAPALLAAAEPGAHEPARSVMLFDPPAIPCAWAMAELGMGDRPWIVVHGREGPRGAAVRHLLASADVLWALEQALRSGQVGAVVAWLPDPVRAQALRRLQLAAQAHEGLVFLLRGVEARLKPSPAPLRLVVHAAGAHAVSIQLIKRRGPALDHAIDIELPPVAMASRAAPRRGTVSLPTARAITGKAAPPGSVTAPPDEPAVLLGAHAGTTPGSSWA